MILALLIVAIEAGATAAGTPENDAPEQTADPIEIASFRGTLIPMDEVWVVAEACLVWPEKLPRPECFDSEQDMGRRIRELERETGVSDGLAMQRSQQAGAVASASQCSDWLRLYDGASYSGQTLYVRIRLQWLNLSSYGFNQKTSSYKIGPCSAYFADWSNGGGDWYPTSLTQAFDQAASMVSGWDNDVSSIYIQ